MFSYILLISLIWTFTSVLKIPAFASLTFAFFALYIWCIKFENMYFSQKNIVRGYILSAVLLHYFLKSNVYPSNISVLVAGLLGLFVFSSENLRNYPRRVFSSLKNVYLKDRVATCIYLIVFLVFIFVGSWYSLGVGLSWDEYIEQETFLKSINTISKGLSGDPVYYEINNYGDRYYGIGFYFPFYMFHRPFVVLISSLYGVANDTAILISRHLAVFWLFSLASIFVSRIVFLLTENLRYSYLVGIAYLVCPYFLGHGMTNVKDSPFASVWIISIFFLIKLSSNYIGVQKVPFNTLRALAFSISWLITIRISGVLFFIPLLVAFIVINGLGLFKKSTKVFKSDANVFPVPISGLQNIYFLVFSTIAFVTLMYPVVWQDFGELFRAIKYMGKHPWIGCTLTYGECMYGQSLPYSYIPAWLAVKLPLASLIGLLVLPVGLYFVYSKGNTIRLKGFLILFLPSLLIPIALILKKTVLYDELRQVLFLVSTFFIAGLISIFYFNKKLSFALVSLSIAIFSFDNIRIYPHQLSWFNEIGRFVDVNGKYETDYWGGRAITAC